MKTKQNIRHEPEVSSLKMHKGGDVTSSVIIHSLMVHCTSYILLVFGSTHQYIISIYTIFFFSIRILCKCTKITRGFGKLISTTNSSKCYFLFF